MFSADDLLAQLGVPLTAERPVLIVAAHPDDETIGASVIIGALPQLRVLFVTDGAPRDPSYARAAGFASREKYACAREFESIAALTTCRVSSNQIEHLGIADQEASFYLPEIAAQMAEIFGRLTPAAVVTHAYEGGHPDHDSTAFAAHAALRLIATGNGTALELLEFTGYFGRGDEMVTSEFLPNAGARTVAIRLSARQREQKERMMRCYSSQQNVLSGFAIDRELFRVAPKYKFTSAPHPGTLHYERYNWGVTGEEWRCLAGEALLSLKLSEPL